MNNLNSTKMNVTDTRFNDTAAINSASTSLQANITSVNASLTGLQGRFFCPGVGENKTYLFGFNTTANYCEGISNLTDSNILSLNWSKITNAPTSGGGVSGGVAQYLCVFNSTTSVMPSQVYESNNLLKIQES